MSPDNINIPKTYLDRSNEERPFYFISYSNKDKESVYPLLNELYKDNVNYWYDIELDPGDFWDERVSNVIHSKHCVGAIVFLSLNSLVSDAVRKEAEIMLSIKEKNRKFRIMPVILGFNNPRELIAKTMNISSKFYDNDDAAFFRHFTESLWSTYDDAKIKLSDVAEKDSAKDRNNLNSGKFSWPGGNHGILFGKYPFDESGNLRDIEWNLVCNYRNQYHFVSKYCLDFVAVKDIQNKIKIVSDSLSDISGFERVELISEDFLNNYSDVISPMLPTDYADKNRQQLLRLFWVLEGDGKTKGNYVFYNAQKIKVEENIVREQINAGIRLVLVINNNVD